jgi:hypothetical protein
MSLSVLYLSLSRRMKMFSNPVTAALLVVVTTTSCIGDMAVKIKRRFVDSMGTPRERSMLTVRYRNAVVRESEVSGAFEQTVVFHPATAEALVVDGSCPSKAHA